MILLDLYLPDMTGDVVLDRLAEDPATADVPVAVIGADAPAQQVRQLLGRGVIGFLAKPIDVRGLLSLVDAVRAAARDLIARPRSGPANAQMARSRPSQ